MIVRIARNSLGPHATTGVLTIDGHALRLHALEDPWRDNKPNISCVPAGRYVLERHESAKYGRTWALVNPGLNIYHYAGQGRYACLIHAGNSARDVQGCVIVGLSSGIRNGEPWLWNSKAAFTALKSALTWTDHELIITN